MSKSEIKNMAHSVNTRLKTIAVQERVAFEYILLSYAVERFLFRLSVSSHADRFILKAGFRCQENSLSFSGFNLRASRFDKPETSLCYLKK